MNEIEISILSNSSNDDCLTVYIILINWTNEDIFSETNLEPCQKSDSIFDVWYFLNTSLFLLVFYFFQIDSYEFFFCITTFCLISVFLQLILFIFYESPPFNKLFALSLRETIRPSINYEYLRYHLRRWQCLYHNIGILYYLSGITDCDKRV